MHKKRKSVRFQFCWILFFCRICFVSTNNETIFWLGLVFYSLCYVCSFHLYTFIHRCLAASYFNTYAYNIHIYYIFFGGCWWFRLISIQRFDIIKSLFKKKRKKARRKKNRAKSLNNPQDPIIVRSTCLILECGMPAFGFQFQIGICFKCLTKRGGNETGERQGERLVETRYLLKKTNLMEKTCLFASICTIKSKCFIVLY